MKKGQVVVVAVLALLACAVALVAADGVSGSSDQWTIVTSGVTLKVLGHSAKFRLYRTAAGEKTSSVEVSFDKLREIDSTGKEVAHSSDLASSDFVWSTPVYELVNGVNTTLITFNTTIRVDQSYVPLSCIVRLYLATGTVVFGNETYTVPKDHVKFTVHIGTWPWLSASNQLQFAMQTKVKDSAFKPSALKKRDDDSRQKRASLGGLGTFDVVSTALVDGVEQPINSTLYTEGNKNGVILTFPHFTSTLDYDPTLGVSSSASASVASPTLLAVGAAALGLLALLTA